MSKALPTLVTAAIAVVPSHAQKCPPPNERTCAAILEQVNCHADRGILGADDADELLGQAMSGPDPLCSYEDVLRSFSERILEKIRSGDKRKQYRAYQWAKHMAGFLSDQGVGAADYERCLTNWLRPITAAMTAAAATADERNARTLLKNAHSLERLYAQLAPPQH